jgi:hypothetical protein
VNEVQFSEEVMGTIEATLSPDADPARLALLPEMLHAWANEDLVEHLSREGRAALRQREKRLRTVGARAQGVIEAILSLDQNGFFKTAFEPQMRHAGTSIWSTDIEAASERRDTAISWLSDLAKLYSVLEDGSGNGKKPKRSPDKAMRYYLIIRDLAAIFELVTKKSATRRVDSDSGQDYGSFADFVEKVWVQIFENKRGRSYAIRVWANGLACQQKRIDAEMAKAISQLSRPLNDVERDAIESGFREYSSFAANLQFRHLDLWRKLTTTPQ